VLVNYVGVRSVDGTEFDNNYDDGQPYPVVLGAGGVIPGWDQGLVGVKTGGRRQLDVPPDLAYGDEPQGDVIQAGDALSFVIDALAVVPASDPADAPTDSVPVSSGATELTTEDIVVGEGAEVVEGSLVFVEIVAYRGDTAEEINTTWGQGGPVALQASEDQTIPGLANGLLGMKAGGRRMIIMPPDVAFGDGGNEELGLPADTDLILVVDLVSVS
jgi:peptidylprolyl isomerase